VTSSGARGGPLPPRAGIGLRGPHVAEVIATRPAVAWLEVHTENYLHDGPPARALAHLRRDYPVALHGVGLSLGTAGGIDHRHLDRIRALADRLEPALVSEHLAWSIVDGVYLNHLLPLPYTEEALAVVCENVARAQDHLRRALLIENPSGYLAFATSIIPEPEFLVAIARRTGARLLVDVNNVHVTAHNLRLDPVAWLDAVPADLVGEIHLAGHARNDADGRVVLVDDHGSRVAPEVWALHEHATRRFGPVPALVEWDTDLPPLAVLLEEAACAERVAASAAGGRGVGPGAGQAVAAAGIGSAL
jgi:uncharacterized protein (UPF0276 family)